MMCDAVKDMLREILYYTNGWNIISKNFSKTNFAVTTKYIHNVHTYIPTRTKAGGRGINASFLYFLLLDISK